MTFPLTKEPSEKEILERVKHRGRRKSISAECGLENEVETFVKISIDKTKDERDRIKSAVTGNFLFSSLDEDQLEDIFDAMFEKKVAKGETIIRQGDEGDYFYVLDSGKCQVFVDNKQVLSYSPGSSFGELALMYNTPRAATVKAVEDSVLWSVDRRTFQKTICSIKSRKRHQYEQFLARCELFSNLSQDEVHQIADVLEEYTFEAGSTVISEGDDDYDQMKFYIVQEGTAEAFQTLGSAVDESKGESKGESKEARRQVLVGTMEQGDFFGEKSLIQRAKRAATVVAKTKLKVAALDIAGFERLMGPCKEIMHRTIANYPSAEDQA